MWREWGKGEVCTGFWWGKPGGKIPLGRHSVDWRITLRWIFRIWDLWVWTRLSWFRVGTGGVH
jgi:hypothetical protein